MYSYLLHNLCYTKKTPMNIRKQSLHDETLTREENVIGTI